MGSVQAVVEATIALGAEDGWPAKLATVKGSDSLLVEEKQTLREAIWERLTAAGVARFPGAHGRIPNFDRAGDAADLLAREQAWGDAQTLKANPDMPQLPVRARALEDGKTLYLAVPRLREEQPFLRLDPEALPVRPRQAVSIKGAARYGAPVAVDEVEQLDLMVCGSVAVNRLGARIGKGGGFSDLELAFAIERGLVTDSTMIVTTVHPLQIIDDELPETEHDFRVDLIITPDEVIRCGRVGRPPGILWEHLDEAKIAAIPVLAHLRSLGSSAR